MFEILSSTKIVLNLFKNKETNIQDSIRLRFKL